MLKTFFRVLLVTCLMTLTFMFQSKYLGFLSINDRVSIFYIPAAVITISSLSLGYMAAPGIFLGALIINFSLYPTMDAYANILISCVPALVSALTIAVMTIGNTKIRDFLRPGMGYTQIDAIDILYFCILHSILNTSIHQLLFFFKAEYGVQFDMFSLMSMMLGDLSGSFLIFILLNIGFTAIGRLIYSENT